MLDLRRRQSIGFLGATTPSADGQRFAAFVQRLRELRTLAFRAPRASVVPGGYHFARQRPSTSATGNGEITLSAAP
jgi:hypothetical protein